ncbi:MAG: hypothetical protein R6U50_05080 [Desulfobacterales bacterium]
MPIGKSTSHEKRVKRRIIGRKHAFFAATSPRLNGICAEELLSLELPIVKPSAVPGGVTFSGRLADCYAANLHLRTATRILMRIGTFKAVNFRQVEKAAGNFPWNLYLDPSCRIRLKASTSKCRLYHTDAIEHHFLSGMMHGSAAVDDHDGSGAEPLFDIYIRGENDCFTVSLDSSGTPLYKRGLKSHPARAPLRETLAAAALRLAGYTGVRPLIDPMCGSGTISLEAAMTAAKIPAGWFREFAFMDWPSFKPKLWEYMKKEARQRFQFPLSPVVFASDVDGHAVSALEKTVEKYGLSRIISVAHRDFFRSRPEAYTSQSGIVFLNPPYGIRLTDESKPLSFYRAVVDKLMRDYRNWTVVWVMPRENRFRGLPFSHTRHPIFHGGLELNLVIGTV